MCKDIEKAMSKRCNFLCALGLVTYTEIMGSIIIGKLGKEGYGRSSFNAFLEYMGNDYKQLGGKYDLCKIVRCGLVHEYFIKGKSMIVMKDGKQKTGVLVNDKGITCFIVETYFQHFKVGLEKYLNELRANGEKMRRFLSIIKSKSEDIAKVEEINKGISGDFVSKTFSRIMEND